jgi:hypothetical protein
VHRLLVLAENVSSRRFGEQAIYGQEVHPRFIAVCFLGFTMKVLLEGLFVVVLLVLEAVGVIVIGRSTMTTEPYPLASRSTTPTHLHRFFR